MWVYVCVCLCVYEYICAYFGMCYCWYKYIYVSQKVHSLYSYELVKDPINGHHCNFEDKQKSSYIQISLYILQSAYQSELNCSCHNYDYIIF